MKYYLAPLEGITSYIYRNAHHDFFQPMDKYFTPFLVPNQTRKLKTRERKDILPEHNKGLYTVPQILTNKSEDFLWAADQLALLGYDEINLNLGCPSKTVVTKGKGSGFLAEPEKLDRFLEQVFSHTQLKISLKTRIGKENAEEFYQLMQIFNQYPLEELIVHPRLQTDYYKNKPNYEMFRHAAAESCSPVVYNGDIITAADLDLIKDNFPTVKTVMLGRGILRNPGLLDSYRDDMQMSKPQLKAFHDRLYLDYQEEMSGERNVLFKMKELWLYMIHIFEDADKYWKKIKKTDRLRQYDEIMNQLFHERCIKRGEG